MITGPAEIKNGTTKKFSLTLTVSGNDGCQKGHEHTTTNWQLDTGNPQMNNKVRKKDEEKTSVKIEVDANCPVGDLVLKADPQVRRKCKGNNAVKVCVSQTNTATIKVV